MGSDVQALQLLSSSKMKIYVPSMFFPYFGSEVGKTWLAYLEKQPDKILLDVAIIPEAVRQYLWLGTKRRWISSYSSKKPPLLMIALVGYAFLV